MAKRYDQAQFYCVDPGWVAGSRLGQHTGCFMRAALRLVCALQPSRTHPAPSIMYEIM